MKFKEASFFIGALLLPALLVLAANIVLNAYLKNLSKVVPTLDMQASTTLTSTNPEIEALPLWSFTIRIPPTRNELQNVNVHFENHKLISIGISIKKDVRTDSYRISRLPLPQNFDAKTYLLGYMQYLSVSSKDWSFWNIIHNIETLRILKERRDNFISNNRVLLSAMNINSIPGLMIAKQLEKGVMTKDLQFYLSDGFFGISYICHAANDCYAGEVLFSDLQPLENKNKAFDDLQKKVSGKKESVYARELLLLSMMTEGELKLSALQELFELMTEKKYTGRDAVEKELLWRMAQEPH